MSLYTAPTLHNGKLNSVFNSSDFEENSTALTIGTADARYLKLSGGTETGSVTFNNGLTSSSTSTFSQGIITPTITLGTAGMSQTTAQIGYYRSFASAITGGSISNGTASAPTFNVLSLSSGVYIVSYYHNISCTASVTFSQITHGITTSSSAVYTQATTNSSYASETLPSGNKYISGTYIFRTSGTVSVYAPIPMSFTTAGTITVALEINAIRVA